MAKLNFPIAKSALPILLLALSITLISAAASATIYAWNTYAELAKLSERIVWAECISVHEGLDVTGTGVATYWTFETRQLVKGELPYRFTVRYSVGSYETEQGTGTWTSDAAPSVAEGENVVLFLGRDGPGGYPLFGFGLNLTIDSVTGQPSPWYPPRDLLLFHAEDGSPYEYEPVDLPFVDFLYSLKVAGTSGSEVD